MPTVIRLSRPVLALVLATAPFAFAKPPPQRTAELRAISLVTVDGGVVGHSVHATARVEKNRSQKPAVGVLGASASAAGDHWSPTLWSAALVATEATDSSLLDYEFSLRVDEPMDGASAGLLTAATLAALIRGKAPLPNTSLTGMLNPDGSAGPVDEVLERLRAAAADGVKRFGFPSVTRPQFVELVAEGNRLGVVVKELGSLDDAYLFLTGEPLPRPAPVKEAEMELWPAELAGIAKATAEVRGELETERPALEAVLERVNPSSLASVRKRLDRAAQQASDFEQSGDAVRALVVWSSALREVRVASAVAELAALAPEAVIERVRASSEGLAAERLAFRRELDTTFPNTNRANDLYAMDLLESVAPQSVGLTPAARVEQLRAVSPKDPGFARLARQNVEELARSREELKNGRRFFSIYAALPTLKKTLPPLDAERLAGLYGAAGDAAYASLRARLTEAMKQDETATLLVGTDEVVRTEADARARLVLSARQNLYSGYLVNAYGSLGASVDGSGVFTVRNARALSVQLELAKLRVLQSCGRARREATMIPFAARIRFLNARAAREGTDRQKSESLADLWISAWWCDLAGKAARAKRP